MNLEKKKEIVARALGVGKGRVKFKPDAIPDIEAEVTKEGFKALVNAGSIVIEKPRGQTHREKVKRHSPGNRKGKRGARAGKKDKWVRQVRALRRYLRSVKSSVQKEKYWEAYRKIKGGEIKTIARLKEFLGESR